jgi:hypothetical protein
METNQPVSVPQQEASRDDRILTLTRIVAIPVVLILISGFVILYLYPLRTKELFAWTINPMMTPLAMGAGYAAGAFFFTRTIFARKWHHVGLGILPITIFSAAMGLATLLHWDKFNHSHVSFWLWTITYVVTPFLIPLVWYLNQKTDPHMPDAVDATLPIAIRWIIGVAGVFQLSVAALLFFAPATMIAIWPWHLTPLTARVLGGWWALPGMGGLLIALEPRWSAVRIILQGTLLYTGLLLLGVYRAWADFDPTNPMTWVYLSILLVSLFGVGALYWAIQQRVGT